MGLTAPRMIRSLPTTDQYLASYGKLQVLYEEGLKKLPAFKSLMCRNEETKGSDHELQCTFRQ